MDSDDENGFDNFLDSIPQALLDLEKESTSLVASLTAALDDDDGPETVQPDRKGSFLLDQPVTDDILYSLPQPLLELEIRSKARLTTASARTLAQEIDWSFLLKLSLINQPKLGPRGVLPLANGWKTLTHLTIRQSKLGHFGIQTLAPLLPSSLRHLDLAANDIGRDGAWKLAGYLPPNLQYLDVSQNQIGDEGCSAMAQHLPDQILKLDANQIGVVGAKALATALQENKEKKQLQELWLTDNQIGDEGTIALAEAVDQCESIKVLELTDNGISESQLQFVTVMLRHRSSSSSLRTIPRRSTSSRIPTTLQSILDIDEQALRRELVNTENGQVWKRRLTEKLQALQGIVQK
jgi:Ran GTPase-activating protein (RanGAP) involved in mRNA processing and transport